MKTSTPLSFLLFVKRRSRAGEKIRQIRQRLVDLAVSSPFELEIVDVREQPYLVEYFRLVATPALVRVSDDGNQVLAGDDIVSQVEYWWPRWQQEFKTPVESSLPETPSQTTSRATQDTAPGLTSNTAKKLASEAQLDRAVEAKIAPTPQVNQDDSLKDALPAKTAADPAARAASDPGQTPHTNDAPDTDETSRSVSPSIPAPSSSPSEPPSIIGRSIDILRLSDEIFQLKQTQEQLEAQLAFKDRIIAMMAHDLRNPLTAASIAVDTLEMGLNPDRESSGPIRPSLTMQLLQNAKRQIRTIDRMITDILQTARRADGEMRIQPQPTDLRPLCMTALESVEATITAKQQVVEVDIPQDLPQIYADAEHIRRLLTNLLDNAVKYTPDQGEIKLTALHRTNQQVQISIQDTGPGIPDSKQAQIFEERFRLQRDQEQDGYGIGLALCRRIVQAHFGKIWVDSVPGEGSTFHVVLPVYRRLGPKQ